MHVVVAPQCAIPRHDLLQLRQVYSFTPHPTPTLESHLLRGVEAAVLQRYTPQLREVDEAEVLALPEAASVADDLLQHGHVFNSAPLATTTLDLKSSVPGEAVGGNVKHSQKGTVFDGEGGGGGRIDDETVVFQREGGQFRKVRNRHLFDEGE